MSEPSVSVSPNDFDPTTFARVLVTRNLTNTPSSMAELGDIHFYDDKFNLCLNLVFLASQMIEQVALHEGNGATALEFWQSVLLANLKPEDL